MICGWHARTDAALCEASRRRLLALEATARREAVYNIEVEHAHTCFAHGILGHNG